MAEFENLVLTDHLSDISIYVGPDKHDAWIFPAHQVLLSLQSPVFTAMFSGGFAESEKEVLIKDISPHIFYKVLQFVYKGVLEVKSLSETFLIFKAADKYQMEILKSECFYKLQEFEITWEIFWYFLTDIYVLWDQLVPFELKLNILIFLDTNAHSVLTDDNFLFLTRETVLMIVSRSTLVVSELVVCNALVRWAQMRCHKNNFAPNSKNQRQVLGDLLYTLRISNIDNKETFASPIYKILTEEEKELVMKVPCKLPKPWILNKPIRSADCRKLFHHQIQLAKKVRSPVYFVFGKHAFVHEIKLEIPYQIGKISLSELSEQGVQTFIKSGPRVDLFYVEAFVCYKLEFEPRDIRFRENVHCSDVDSDFIHFPYSSWGFETDNDPAVFFSSHEFDGVSYKEFLSFEYWKEAFSTRRNPIQNRGTCMTDVVATFC